MYRNDKRSDGIEDEDSRGTVIDSTEITQPGYFSYAHVIGNTLRLKTLSQCTPPPLTPICEINCLREGIDVNNQNRTAVPKLKRIQNSGRYLLQMANSDQNAGIFTKTKEWTIKKNGKLYKIIIPHNVLPSLSEGSGSVSINVPELGPVMLKINPHFKDLKVPELEPFSLNFDEIIKTVSEPSSNRSPKHILQPINLTDLMFDSRFCWIQPKYRHYADSFKLSFNGFSKTDMQKARRCLRNFSFGIKKLENILDGTAELGKKIGKIANKSIKEINNTGPIQGCSSLDVICDSSDILTPKIIISTFENVKAEHKLLKPHIKVKEQLPVKVIKKNGTKIYFKPCFVKLFRDKTIDNVANIHSIESLKSKQIFKSASKLSMQQKLHLFNVKLISNEQIFTKKMNQLLKPLLILNDVNFSNVNFASESKIYDIVYPVDPSKDVSTNVLKDNAFVNAVRCDNIKVVDSYLLVKFLRNTFGPSLD